MSIRIALCFLFVLGFSIYAYRNWFVSLCASILLMAVIQHPDMPKNIGGIQGLNPWNLLFLNVLIAWSLQRGAQGLRWDLPRSVAFWLLAYFGVISVSFLRFLLRPEAWDPAMTTAYLVSEFFVNCVKWVLPGLLLYDGCRTERRVTIALWVVLALYVLLALQVVRWMPLSYAVSGSSLSHRASKIIQNEIGYNRVTLSMMLCGGAWAILTALGLLKKRSHKLLALAGAALVALGQALTAGRSGYAAWVGVGLVLALLRWRRLFFFVPVAALAIGALLPGVRERVLQGVGGRSGHLVIRSDDYEITSGRTLAWPYVIRKIGEAPLLGYGRLGMITTGLRDRLMAEHDEPFPHPHQAYLEWLLDNGLVGFALAMPFYLLALWHGVRLLLVREHPLPTAVGGVACSLVFALLIASFGGQTFYPREGSVGMWAALGIMFRVSVEWARHRRGEHAALFGVRPRTPVPAPASTSSEPSWFPVRA